MAELYLIGFNNFELRDSNGDITNEELQGFGQNQTQVGWNTDDPNGNQQLGEDAADEWVDNAYTITFTDYGQLYQIDDNDNNFDDDDPSQTLGEDVSFGTETYSVGEQIEAEFHITVQNPNTGETWVLSAISIGGSGNGGYSTIEGFAVVAGNSLPPLNVALDIIASVDLAPGQGTTSGSAEYEEYVMCFAAGAKLDTPKGPRAIETLRIGDYVNTRDHGAKPILWIGKKEVSGHGKLAPIRIRKGVLGATEDLWLSPNHRVLLTGWDAEMILGEPEALVCAKHLTRLDGIHRHEQPRITYYHILFDDHELILANGVPSESFLPNAQSLSVMDAEVQAEVFEIFPQLRQPSCAYKSCRPVLSKYEAALMRRDATLNRVPIHA